MHCYVTIWFVLSHFQNICTDIAVVAIFLFIVISHRIYVCFVCLIDTLFKIQIDFVHFVLSIFRLINSSLARTS